MPQKPIGRLHTMVACEGTIKSPLIPLFHKGIFLCRTLTRLWKKHALSAVEERGKGRFSGEMSTESCGKFQRKKTRLR